MFSPGYYEIIFLLFVLEAASIGGAVGLVTGFLRRTIGRCIFRDAGLGALAFVAIWVVASAAKSYWFSSQGPFGQTHYELVRRFALTASAVFPGVIETWLLIRKAMRGA